MGEQMGAQLEESGAHFRALNKSIESQPRSNRKYNRNTSKTNPIDNETNLFLMYLFILHSSHVCLIVVGLVQLCVSLQATLLKR